MKVIKTVSRLVYLTVMGLFISCSVSAQPDVPPQVASITKMSLEDGQEKLTSLGYEVCSSSLFGKKQDWFNESTQNCITVKFDKKKVITEVLLNPETSECQKELEASRKVWEKYYDGQADVSSSAIDKERDKLKTSGYLVSYWIYDIAPGRSTEYWWNEKENKCKQIMWNTPDKGNVSTASCEKEYAKNPAPPRN